MGEHETRTRPTPEKTESPVGPPGGFKRVLVKKEEELGLCGLSRQGPILEIKHTTYPNLPRYTLLITLVLESGPITYIN